MHVHVLNILTNQHDPRQCLVKLNVTYVAKLQFIIVKQTMQPVLYSIIDYLI